MEADRHIARTYGQLALLPGGEKWELADVAPHVSIRLKHIFPRIPKGAVPPYKLNRSASIDADLDWFMSRYPLAMTPEDREALTGGRLSFERNVAEMERILLPDYKPTAVTGLRDGKKLRHYQQQAIDIMRRRGSLLVGDEGGLGKTITAAGFLCAEPLSLPAAVVCDSHMQKQWKDKIEEFTRLRVHIVKKGSPYDLPPADVYIYRVTQIAGWANIFATGLFKTVIYDEPQSLRTGTGTAKGASASVLSLHTNFRMGLTATPIYNYGTEMFNVMGFIDPTVLGDRDDFYREWCDHNGRISDPKALGTYLREQHAMLRRLKSDVGLELPKVSRIVEHVDYDAKVVASVEALARQLALKATSGSFTERGTAVRELDAMMRHTTGVSKAPAVAQFVRMLVEAGEPVMLFGWHRDVYDIWLRDLADLNPAMYTGTETASKKAKSAEAFLRGETDILILSLRSGAGLDGLQMRCSTVVFGELDWSPMIHQQGIWRVDRDGQINPVTAFFLVTDDGSDPPIMEVLGIKASEAQGITDPHLGVQKVDNDTTNLRKLVERYLDKKHAGAAQGVEVVALPPAAPPPPPGTSQTDLFDAGGST